MTGNLLLRVWLLSALASGPLSSADGTDRAVAELYEDLRDSVVFEDTGGDGTPVDRQQEQRAAVDARGPRPAVQRHAAAGETGGEQDAAPARRYPEYVRASSYRQPWPGGNVTRPERLFGFWDPYEWTPAAVSARCAEHMERYRAGLLDGDAWAFKSKFVSSSRPRTGQRVQRTRVATC